MNQPWMESRAFREGLEQLVERSRRLGSDPMRVTPGGGNTSSKVRVDSASGARNVLCVKGSGVDLAAVESGDFALLDLDRLRASLGDRELSDQGLSGALEHSACIPGRPRPSIETPLHALLPGRHVDHSHPVAVLAFAACSDGGQELARLLGPNIAWIPYVRPGLRLGRQVADCLETGKYQGALLDRHGLVTWSDDSRECFDRHLACIQAAETALTKRLTDRPVFGGQRMKMMPAPDRLAALNDVQVSLRAAFPEDVESVLAIEAGEEIGTFVNSVDFVRLAGAGYATPEHVLRLGRAPLVVEPKGGSRSALTSAVERAAEAHRKSLVESGSSGVVSIPRVTLVAGVGAIFAGRDASGARQAMALFLHSLRVVRMAESADGFRRGGVDPAEAAELERSSLARERRS